MAPDPVLCLSTDIKTAEGLREDNASNYEKQLNSDIEGVHSEDENEGDGEGSSEDEEREAKSNIVSNSEIKQCRNTLDNWVIDSKESASISRSSVTCPPKIPNSMEKNVELVCDATSLLINGRLFFQKLISKLNRMTQTMFTAMCVLAGSDYTVDKHIPVRL